MAKLKLEEAEQAVESYINPKNCFVIYVDNKNGWQPLSGPLFRGTGCAHYVSHILGIQSTKSTRGMGCKSGYETRVRALVAHLTEITADEVQVNDVWARLKGEQNSGGGSEPTNHCGIVIAVESGADGTKTITIRHNSSGQKATAENDWSYFKKGGKFYRAANQAVVPPSVQANATLAKHGLPLRPA